MIFKPLTAAVLFIVLLFVCHPGAIAQRVSAADSLKKLLTAEKSDTGKVTLMVKIGDAREDDNDYEGAKIWYKKAGDLSKKISYNKGIFKYLFNYLDAYVQLSHYDSSLYYSDEAISLARKLRDTASLMQAMFTAGVSYNGLSDYKEAISNLLPAGDYFAAKKDDKKQAFCYNEMQLAYRHLGQYKNAVDYGQKTLAAYYRLKAESSYPTPLINLALDYMAMNEPEKSIPYLKRALVNSNKYHKEYSEIGSCINLASAEFLLNNYSNSIKEYAQTALMLSRKIASPETEGNSLALLGQWYLHNNRLAEAKAYADSALGIAIKNKLQVNELDTYSLLSKIAFALRDYKNGGYYDKQSEIIRGKIENEQLNHSVIELQTRYETGKKQALIRQLESAQQIQQLTLQRRRGIIFTLVLVIAALMLIGWLLYKNSRRRQALLQSEKALQEQQITELQKERQLQATQAVLRGQEEERGRLAKDLHDGLGGMLSGTKYLLGSMKEDIIISSENAATFERTMDMLDYSIAELRRVAHNMMPESLLKLNLDEAVLDYCRQITDSGVLTIIYQAVGMKDKLVDNTVKIAAYRVIQELINNIIKHAGAPNAMVQITGKENLLTLTVEDNGKGFDVGSLQTTQGIGYRNIKGRIEFLNGKIDVRSQMGKGTSVYIEIPA